MGRLDSYKVFVSKSEKNYASFSKIYIGRNNSVISNGVEVRDIKKYPKKYKKNKNDLFSNLTIISICRFVAQKNIKEFIQIAEKLKEYNFILIGNGPLWNDIKWCRIDHATRSNDNNIYLMQLPSSPHHYQYEVHMQE